MPEFSARDQPYYAHKGGLIELETAKDILSFIQAAGFSTPTSMTFALRVRSAGGKEFRMANLDKYEAIAKYCLFKMGDIENEVQHTREERERLAYWVVVMNTRELYSNNLSQATRDEYGRNAFIQQYIEETRQTTSSEVEERAHVTHIQPPGQPGGGFSLKNVPVIGGFIK